MFLVVGLGNPGSRYLATRHNVGFLVLDQLARRSAASIDRPSHGAVTTKAQVGGQPVLLAKPQQFMNRSGGPVGQLASFYKVSAEQIVVVHDDLDLDFGAVRVKVGGGHGGHNGLRDLNQRLGNGYLRVRVGISRPPPGWDPANYVLAGWTDDESAQLEEVVHAAADAVEAVVREGAAAAMNRINERAKGSPAIAPSP